MKFEINDKVRVKKSAGVLGGKIYTIENISDDGYVYVEDKVDSIGDGWLQLILESPKLSLRLSQKGLTLKVKILHQDESLRCEEEITRHEDFTLESCNCPELSRSTLFIRGEDTDKDNVSPKYKFNTQGELDSFVSALRIMMKDDKLK